MLPSLRMGRYVVEGLLGPGGVTETYLARLADEPESDQLFALKLLRQDALPAAHQAEIARRFVAAGRRLAELRRPGFGRVVEVSDDPECVFVVTDFVPGHDLARLLAWSRAEAHARPGVDPALVGLIGAEIARLLQVAHTGRPPLHHLGLGPQNVVVSDDGEVVLLDAGIAAAIRGSIEQTPERGWFIAPELAGGAHDERVGVAADLYSLGALLHYLLAGALPDASALAANALPELPGVSAKLSTALRSLLSAHPQDRPESAVAVIDRLAGGIGSVPKRQRAIAEGLRQAELEARAAAERSRPSAPAPEILVPRPADSLLDDVYVAALPWRGGRRARRRRLAWATAFAALGLIAALLSSWLSRGAQRFASTAAPDGPAPAVLAPSVLAGATGAAGAPGDRGPPTRERILGHLAGRLVAETVPPGATVWIDGVRRGTTFAELEVGPGSHRVALTRPGYRSFRDVVDTGKGAIIRRNLVPAPLPARDSGWVRVECQTVGKFPILIDDEETGAVCPELRLPAAIGKRTVGIFLPASGRVVSVGVTVERGARPAVAKFSE